MTANLLARDHAFREWLAARPGLWLEVGVFDDAGQLVMLVAERRRLCLPPIAALRSARVPGARRHAHPVPTRAPVTSGMIGGRP